MNTTEARIPYGDAELRASHGLCDELPPCKCGAKHGHFHVPGCDLEDCPICGGYIGVCGGHEDNDGFLSLEDHARLANLIEDIRRRQFEVGDLIMNRMPLDLVDQYTKTDAVLVLRAALEEHLRRHHPAAGNVYQEIANVPWRQRVAPAIPPGGAPAACR